MLITALIAILIFACFGRVGSGAAAGAFAGAVLSLALYVAVKVAPSWIAGQMPKDLLVQTPWVLPAFQWAIGLNLVGFALVAARVFYRKSLGM